MDHPIILTLIDMIHLKMISIYYVLDVEKLAIMLMSALIQEKKKDIYLYVVIVIN